MDTLPQVEIHAVREPTRAELIDALRFYASKANWEEYLDGKGARIPNLTPVSEDKGKRARYILRNAVR